jgi:hypothetical protein
MSPGSCLRRRRHGSVVSALAVAAALVGPAGAVAAQSREHMPRTLWEVFPLEPPPAAGRLDPPGVPPPVTRVVRLPTRTAAGATGDPDPIPPAAIVLMAAAAAAALLAGGVPRVGSVRGILAGARGRLQVGVPHRAGLPRVRLPDRRLPGLRRVGWPSRRLPRLPRFGWPSWRLPRVTWPSWGLPSLPTVRRAGAGADPREVPRLQVLRGALRGDDFAFLVLALSLGLALGVLIALYL